MSNNKSGGWGPVEIAVVAVILLVLCGGVGLILLMAGGFFIEEELARESAPAAATAEGEAPGDAFAPITDASQDAAGDQQPDAEAEAPQTISLSTPASAPGTTVTIQGEGWPAGSRIIISLVPSEPPSYAVNSAIAGQDGRFSVEMIVPSDPRWLDESPVPVVAATGDNQTTAQTSLTIASPLDSAPLATPAASSDVVVVSAVSTAASAPPPSTVAQLATTANLNVRAGPGTNFPVLGVLLLGQQAEIIGRNENATWWQVKFPGVEQGYGWVSAQFVQASNIGNVPVVRGPDVPAQPTPVPTPTPQPGLEITDWRGEYFNNENLQGAPVLVRNDVAISFDWGLGSPDQRIPADNFSARWTRAVNFSAGTYRFYARVDDGVRLWVDGALLINQWREQSPTTYAADIYLAEGSHTLMMEYNELAGGATAILSWNRVDTYPDWKAEYYTNPDLQGGPVLVRNEGSINYNWGSGSPAAGIPADNFSVRWTRVSNFDGGDYLFRIVSDDGHRVFLDNNLILDNWRDGNTGVLETRRTVPAGLHELRVEYFERGGDALIGLSWQRADRPQVGPLAIIRGSDNGIVGEPVKFDGRRSRAGDSPIDKYEWDFGDGSRTRGDRVSHTYDSAGDYRVRLRVTDKNGLRDTTTLRVRVDDDLQATTAPFAIVDGPSTGKAGEAVDFSGRRSLSLSPIVDYRWTFDDGTTGRGQDVSHIFSQAGTYNVILTAIAENGLRGSDSLSLRIDDPLAAAELPVARVSAPSQGQTGQPVTFDASQSTARHPLVSWQWNFGDGANANGPTVPHTFNRPGTYNVTLTVTDDQGQSNTANQVIAIADPPPSNQPPVPAISGPAQTIAGQAVTFDGSGSQSSNQITNYNWDFGDGTTASGPIVNHTYTQVGDFTVTLNVTDDQGQQASLTQPVRVDPKPQPDPLTANISGPTQGQVGQTLSFDGQSSTSAAPLSTIQWDFGDGNSASGQLVVSHVYQNPGTYTVLMSLVNDLGQNDTASLQLVIQDPPPANTPPQPAIQADATTVAAGGTVSFDASGTAAASPIVSYAWDFGDGTTGSGQLVSHDFTQPGTYDVVLTVTDQNGQSSTATQTVTVNPAAAQPPPPAPNISAPSAQGQAGQPITFNGQQSVSGTPPSAIQWDFGDGTTAGGTTLNDLVVSHTYQQPGDYTVQLTLSDQFNQSGTATFDVSIQPAAPPLPPPPPPPPSSEPPTAEIAGPTQAMVGEAVVFDGGYSHAGSPITAYEWGFGDGVSADGMGATHAYAAPGTYNVTLNIIDENGLSSSASHAIEIIAPQQPAEPTEPAAPEVLPAETPAPESEPTESPAPEAEPAEAQPQPAQPTPAQPPTASISGPGQVQAGAPVSFSGSGSALGSSAIVAYQWGFGDGNSDNGADVSHTFAAEGQVQVTLTVVDENGLSNTASLPVFVGPSQAELDAQRAAEAEAQRQAQEEAQRQAEEAAQRQAEEAQRQAEEEAQRQAEEEARLAAEEAQPQAEEEAQRQAEEQARQQAEEEAQRQAQEEAQRQAEEAARQQAKEKKAKQPAPPEPAEQQPDAPVDDGSGGN